MNILESMPDLRIPTVMQAPTSTPVRSGGRLDFIDILRGFAVYGILIMNVTAFSGQLHDLASIPDPIDKAVVLLVDFLVQAKFYSLFSFLFGWGMAEQLKRAESKGARFSPVFLRRMLILLGIGVLHAVIIWYGDILILYALLGILLVLFRKRSQNLLLLGVVLCLLLSIVLTFPGEIMVSVRTWYANLTNFLRSDLLSKDLLATGTYAQIIQLNIQETLNGLSEFIYYFGNVFGMFLLGLFIGKRGLFHHVSQNIPLFRKVMWIGLGIGVIFNAIFVRASAVPGWIPPEYERFVRVGSRTIGAPALMLFYVCGIILLLRRESWRKNLAPLANVGRMALTNYILQSVICVLIFYSFGLGLYGETSPAFNQILALMIFVVQVRISSWLFDHYQYGPLEWIWRALTYGQRPPLRLGQTHDDLEPALWLTKVRQVLANVNPLVALICVWLVLLAWGVGLLVWNVYLNTRDTDTPLLVVVKVTATPQQSIGGESDNTLIKPGASAFTPLDVHPMDYQPGPIAASGDVLSLASTFDVEKAFDHIETLSSPSFMGRYAGSPGGWAAGAFIADQFAQYGLQPAGEGGEFFQPFSVTYTPLSEVPGLIVQSPDGAEHDQYNLHEDFSPIVQWYSGPGMVSGDVAWVDDCSQEAFKGLDVVDKVVLCVGGLNSDAVKNSSRNAIEHGAAGLLFLTDQGDRPPDFGYTFHETWVPDPLPTFRVYPSVGDDLLSGSGMIVEDLFANPPPFYLDARVSMELGTSVEGVCQTAQCQGRNVLGVIPGRDPEYADQVVILGAHYDHLGQGPDGTLWPGANDDASGVAILLEIARSWQEQGYVPMRTVVFAAWDAEETGLLGSQNYVRRPSYPIESTVAMIQLDMVGAGPDRLSISGEEGLSAHIYAVSEILGIDAEVGEMGRSDHIPFLESNVPASLLIWYAEDQGIPHWHRPIDTPEVIQLNKLEVSANIAEIALLDLVESEPAILNLLARRAEAVERGELEPFLATSTPDQAAVDRYWFTDLQTFAPSNVEIHPFGINVQGLEATADVEIRVEYANVNPQAGPKVMSGRIPSRFKHDQDGWHWAGPDLDWVEDTRSVEVGEVSGGNRPLGVAYPPGKGEGMDELGNVAAEKYSEIASLLGLRPYTDAALVFFPDGEALRVSTAMSMPSDRSVWVSSEEIRLLYSEQISTSLELEAALAQLLLAEAGVTETAAPWLWEGLPLVLRAHGDRITVHQGYIPILAEAVQTGEFALGEVASWAATDYLLERLGWQGLGAFISALGKECNLGFCDTLVGLDSTLNNTLQMEAAAFKTAWQSYWIARLETIQEDLDRALSIRERAVLEGDENAFLNTVDPGIPLLFTEQQNWFADLDSHPVDSFQLAARPITLFEDGSVLALVTMKYQLADSNQNNEEEILETQTLFTQGESGFRWGGAPFNSLRGQRVNIRYPDGQVNLAQDLLKDTELMVVQLAAELGVGMAETLKIALYEDSDGFRSSISLSISPVEWATGWTGAGEGVKLKLVSDSDPEGYKPILVTQISRNLLGQMGVDSEWLLKGMSAYLSHPYDGGVVQNAAAALLPELSGAARNGSLSDLWDLSRDDELSKDAFLLARAQSLDAVRYFIHAYGWGSLLDLSHAQIQGLDMEAALQSSIGRSLDSFQEDWKASLAQGHIQPEWIEVVESFDQDAAKGHVDHLANRELAGRKAGSRGGEVAAAYIAGRFQASGLTPIGNPESASFYQTFPISDTSFISAPLFAMLNPQAQPQISFSWREDFLLIQPVTETVGSVRGELVWVQGQEDQVEDLSGKIVVMKADAGPLADEIAWADGHGASGLIIAGYKREGEDIFTKQPLMNFHPLASRIPVIELTQAGTSRFLEALDQDRKSIEKLPAPHPLGVAAQLDFTLAAPETVQTSNILGLLPGSDPYLSKEVIVIGAHYDHVGDDPESLVCSPEGNVISDEATCEWVAGLPFSGANDNASGVAVLLEVARLWQEIGYRPRRSVLFAAWGAQESGQLGSRYFVAHPALPLEDLTGVIQLDGVGGGEGFNPGVQGSREGDGLLLFNMDAAGKSLESKLTVTPYLEASDHFSFYEIDIPSILVSWRLASEANLPDGIAHSVVPDRLGIVGRLAALGLMNLAR